MKNERNAILRRSRCWLFRVGIVVVFVVMVARMYQLQVMRGEEYRTLADENRLVRLETAAPRGVIYDRNGTILVRNRPSFEVALVPEFLPIDNQDTEDAMKRPRKSKRCCASCAPTAATSTWHCAWPS